MKKKDKASGITASIKLGKLVLCDLAGSERAAKSAVCGKFICVVGLDLLFRRTVARDISKVPTSTGLSLHWEVVSICCAKMRKE